MEETIYVEQTVVAVNIMVVTMKFMALFRDIKEGKKTQWLSNDCKHLVPIEGLHYIFMEVPGQASQQTIGKGTIYSLPYQESVTRRVKAIRMHTFSK